MLAFMINNEGVIMALDFAAILGAGSFGLEETGLIIFFHHRAGDECRRRAVVW